MAFQIPIVGMIMVIGIAFPLRGEFEFQRERARRSTPKNDAPVDDRGVVRVKILQPAKDLDGPVLDDLQLHLSRFENEPGKAGCESWGL